MAISPLCAKLLDRIAIEDAVPGTFDVLLTSYEMLSKDPFFFTQRFFWSYVVR